MNIIIIIISALIIGFLEFAPVSSNLLGSFVAMFTLAEEGDIAAFSIALKIGVLIALIICFRQQSGQIVKAGAKTVGGLFTGKIFKRSLKSDEKLFTAVVESLIPVPIFILIGAFNDSIARDSEVIVEAIAFIISGIMLITMIKVPSGKKSIASISPFDAFILGVYQCMSSIPGVSRVALTVAYPILRKHEKYQSFLFSFIIYIPYLLIMIVRDIWLNFGILSEVSLLRYIPGIVLACAGAVLSINAFKMLFKTNKYHWFAYLNIFIGLVLIVSELF